MSVQKVIPLIIAISITLFTFNLALPMNLTTNRVANLLIITVAMLLMVKRKIKFRVKSLSFNVFLISAYFLIIIGALSILFTPFQAQISTYVFMLWALIMLISLIIWQLSYSMNGLSENTLINTLVLGAAVLTLYTLYEVFYVVGVGNVFTFSEIRRAFIFNLGLNNYLTRLFVINVFPIAIAVGIVERRGLIKFVSILTSIIFVFLVFSSGSRQSLFAVIAFIIILYITNSSFSYKPRFKEVVSIIILVFIITAIFQYKPVQAWFEARYIDYTVQQIQEGPYRLDLYRYAINTIADYPFLGVGPGVYRSIRIGYGQPHNGFLLLGAEFGVIAFLFVVFSILFLAIRSFKMRMNSMRNGMKSLFIISFSFLVTWVFINAFNDILSVYGFWIIMSLMATSVELRKDLKSDEE